jgi:hypothetical protein
MSITFVVPRFLAIDGAWAVDQNRSLALMSAEVSLRR